MSLCYIQRCFTSVCETENFLELDFNRITFILSSSQLNITSELEVLNAAVSWLKHKVTERSCRVKDLLFKVRFPLLSNHALKHVLKAMSSLSKSEECSTTIKNYLNKDEALYRNKESSYYTNRYCRQKEFSFVFAGGYVHPCSSVNLKCFQIEGRNFRNVTALAPLTSGLDNETIVSVKDQVYVFLKAHYPYGLKFWERENLTLADLIPFSIKKYTPANKTWVDLRPERPKHLERLVAFHACAFMDKVYVVGGEHYRERDVQSHCFEFDFTGGDRVKIKNVSCMNQERLSPFCAAFNGKVVVSGGQTDDGQYLKNVETYDHVADEWTYMASMIAGRCHHSLVAMGNKLFAVGGWREMDNLGRFVDEPQFEVFDVHCERFVALKIKLKKFALPYLARSIGSKVVLMDTVKSSVALYDVESEKWSEERCEEIGNLMSYSCLKLPHF